MRHVWSVSFLVVASTIVLSGVAGGTVHGTTGQAQSGEFHTSVTTNESGPAAVYNVSSVGVSYYTVDGDQQPTLTLERGKTYVFEVDTLGHPFHISTDASGGSYGGIYVDGVQITQGGTYRTAVERGTLEFTVPESAPDTLYYQCGNHAGMGARLNITDAGSGQPNYQNPTGNVSFAAPANGSTVTTPVSFNMSARDFVVEPATAGVEAGHGHLHILVDHPPVPAGQPIPTSSGYYHYGDGSTSAQLDLAPGNHTVVLQAGDANHNAYALTDRINITVETSGSGNARFDTNSQSGIQAGEIVDAIVAFNARNQLGGQPVDAGDIVDLIVAFNT